jgi:putative endopeptidase
MKFRFYIFITLITINYLAGQEIKPIDLSIVDSSIQPGDNFYKFCSGNWLNTTQLPSDKHRYGFFDIAEKETSNKIHLLIQKCANSQNANENHLQNNIGNFFLSGINTKKINELGKLAITKQLEMIENISNYTDLTEVIAQFQLYGINPLFKIYDYSYWEVNKNHYLYLRQSELSLPNKYYNNSSYKKEQKILKQYIADLFIIEGTNPETSQKYSNIVFQIESQLAQNSYTESELRVFGKNFNQYSIQKLENKFNHIDWEIYLNTLNIKDKKIIIGQPAYFDEINNLLSSTSIRDWKVYLKYRLLFKSAKYLSANFSDRNNTFIEDIYGTNTSNLNNESFVIKTINNSLPNLIGHIYSEEYLDEESIIEIKTIIKNLQSAFIQRIEDNDWLSGKAKLNAITKIKLMTFKIGGPELDKKLYDNLNLSKEEFLQNIFLSNKVETNILLNRCGKPKKNSEWSVTAQSTNAWYSSTRNDITIPAGNINQLFNKNYDNAYNYGTFATTIAHEMTHGFDNIGRNYDANGNMKNLWTLKDEKHFKNLSLQLINQYNEVHLIDNYYVNGNATLAENIADLGGVNIAYDAFVLSLNNNKTETNINQKQQFYIAFAQKWRDILNSETKKSYALYYQHAPPEARCNEVLYNIDSFYDSFNIKSGKKYKKESERITIW